MAMNNTVHLRDDRERLYVLRKEDGKDLTSIQDCDDASTWRLEAYIKKS